MSGLSQPNFFPIV